jgi:hypothetical protein
LLYEDSHSTKPGRIEFNYGDCPQGDATSTTIQVGLKGTNNTWATNVNNLRLLNVPTGTTCNWSNAVAGNANNSNLSNNNANLNLSIPTDLLYSWSPQSAVVPVRTFSAVASITSSGAVVSWTAPSGASQYNVQYRIPGTCSWTNWSGNPVATNSVTLTGLTPLTSYQVRVQAFNGSNFAPYSHIPNSAGGGDGYTTTGTFTTLASPPTITTTAPSATNYCANAGQSITITGTFFTAVSSVTFNGVAAASFVVNSTTQITAVTPAGISAGNLVVTTAAGASNNWAYSVVANPVVTLSPNDTIAACGSYNQVVTASGASTYVWNAISGSIADLSSTTVANPTVAATGNGTFRVIGTDANGCTALDTLQVNYSVAPYVTVGLTIPQFCGSGGTTVVSASSVNPNYTYAFSVISGGSLSNITATTADYTIASTSSVRVTATDNIGLCAVQRDTAVGVLSFPTLSMAATPDTICVGGTSVLSSGLSAGNFSSQSITFAPLSSASSTNLAAAGVAVQALASGSLDDGGWSGIPVGFNFNFFGTGYTTCNVSTNGTIFFGTYNAGYVSDFTFATLPSLTEPLGMVAALAMDNNLAGADGGTIKYWTTGTAPYRKFVISFEAVKEFGDTKYSTTQAIFYETTGQVEVHVTSSTNQDRNKLVGINGPTGTIGVLAFASGTVAAANNPIVTSFAYRFTPPSNYTTNWTPAIDISGSASGTNLFSVTTNALSTLGTNTFNLYAQDQITGCDNGLGDDVVVEVLAIPANVGAAEVSAYGSVLGIGSADSSSPLDICGDQTYTANFTGTLGGLESINWYDAATGGTLLASGSTYTSGTISAGTSDTIYVEITNGFCSSASRTMYVVDNATPTAVTIILSVQT